jgi:hypothetical protein
MPHTFAIWRVLGLAVALLAVFMVTQPAAPVAVAQGGYAESFTLTGLVEQPKTFTQADLMARMVIGSNKRGGRLVSNVVRIEVRDVDSPPHGM